MASSEDPHQPFHWQHAELEDRDYQIRGRTVFFAILLFVTVLIFTLLFAYIRWACSFYQDTAYPSSRPLPPPPPQPRGLDPATINALPITTITCGRGPLEECCICLGVFEDGEKVKILPSCKHSYHSECVDSWLSAESSCPLCRAPLRVESVLHQVPVIVTQ